MPHYLPNFTETINLGATVRSTALPVKVISFVGYALRTTGTAAGAWSIQYSNDFIPGFQPGAFPAGDDPTSDAKWDTYTLTTTPPAAAGAPQTFGIVLDFYEYAFIRIKFTYASGAGSALIIAQSKG